MMDLGGSNPEKVGRVVHRASLLRELLAPLPPDRLHASKALSEITPTAEDCIKVTFSDGQEETFHAVIGADGIFGAVRRHVLKRESRCRGPLRCRFLGL